tara:strand:+ start:996 stop:1826 length:831 start_codon:yes stop_codon:yes gene_type:complete
MNKTAILLTCFNRKDKTLACLKSLFEINNKLDVYLVDDGSTDGTAKAIESTFPNVKIIKGSAELFWNRGMHLAWENARKANYDFYIWLNDDVELYPDALNELFSCSEQCNNEVIISGIIENKERTLTIYGGSDVSKKIILANGQLNPITNMNGNVVLVSKFVFNELGNLDPVFHHDLGDVDYGLRAKKKGINVFTTRKAIAIGEANSISRMRLNSTTVSKRFKRLYSPIGSNPFINFHFRKRHRNVLKAAVFFIFQHILNIIPDKLNSAIFNNRYT